MPVPAETAQQRPTEAYHAVRPHLTGRTSASPDATPTGLHEAHGIRQAHMTPRRLRLATAPDEVEDVQEPSQDEAPPIRNIAELIGGLKIQVFSRRYP